MGRIFGGFGIRDLFTPLASSRSASASSTQATVVPVDVNNRVVYVDRNLEKDVCDAVALINRDYSNAGRIKKELILNPDLLIALLNQAKLYWHSWVSKTQGKNKASRCIESAFINNENLSKDESDLVNKTILEYKNKVDFAIELNSLSQISLYKPHINSL